MSSILKFLPHGFVFQPAELRVMGQAFDMATQKNPTLSRNAIADAIFKAARSGEHDSQMLLQAALNSIEAKALTFSR